MPVRVRDCPCFSGLRYAACCAPRHDGTRPAETPEALMRSRYAAFALGLARYLVDTLSSEHPDRAEGDEALVSALSSARGKQRFLGLRIVFASEDADRGEVLFVARIFSGGVDRSFAELSEFVREDGAWRYAGGLLVDRAALPDDLAELTREGFLALAIRG
jgi:SEC-C motif domain protein